MNPIPLEPSDPYLVPAIRIFHPATRFNQFAVEPGQVEGYTFFTVGGSENKYLLMEIGIQGGLRS